MEIAQLEAVGILEPHFNSIWRIVTGAWGDYNEHYKEMKHKYTPTCRANIIHSHMVDNAKKEFEGVKGVKPMVIDGLFILSIENKLVVRFKKLDDDMKSRNYPTNRQIDYLAQMDIPGIPLATRLEAGYQLNELQTGYKSVLITCPQGSKIAWYLEVQEPPATNIHELPMRPVDPDKPSRIAVKEGERKEAKKNARPGD